MDIEGLLAEVRNDPLNRGYAAMSNQQRWDSLQTKNRVKYNVINSRVLLAWSAAEGRRLKLENAAINVATNDLVKSACLAALDMIHRSDTMLDLNDASQSGLLDALVAGSVLSAEDRTSLYTIATNSISRAEEIECSDCSRDYFEYLMVLNQI